jgi:hypothetical protein
MSYCNALRRLLGSLQQRTVIPFQKYEKRRGVAA